MCSSYGGRSISSAMYSSECRGSFVYHPREKPWTLKRSSYSPEPRERWVSEYPDSRELSPCPEETSLYVDDSFTDDSGCRFSDSDRSGSMCKTYMTNVCERARIRSPKQRTQRDPVSRWISQLETVEEVDTDFRSACSTVCRVFLY